jgi:hypothetical protein
MRNGVRLSKWGTEPCETLNDDYYFCILLTVVLLYFLQPYLKQGEGLIVLVRAPTRELAVQIKEECD